MKRVAVMTSGGDASGMNAATRAVVRAGASAAEDSAGVLERMRAHGVRRIPVVDDAGRILGIVTLDDVLRLHAEQAVLIAEIVQREQKHENRKRR